MKVDLLRLLSKRDLSRIKCKKSRIYYRGFKSNLILPRYLVVSNSFVEGIGYYVGDGRVKSRAGLSTVNSELSVIVFYLNWLYQFFKVNKKDIILKVYFPLKISKPDVRKYSKLFDINNLQSLIKYKGKKHHRVLFEANVNRAILKRVFDSLLPLIKKRVLKNKRLAFSYINGLMVAEGSPRYHKNSSSRSIHLKMKDEEEIRFISRLLRDYFDIKTSILKSESQFLIVISGKSDLLKLKEKGLFCNHSRKRIKLSEMLDSYKREQVKKGNVGEFYLGQILKYKKIKKELPTSPLLAKFIGRSRITVSKVLKSLYRSNKLSGFRSQTRGRPFVFDVVSK